MPAQARRQATAQFSTADLGEMFSYLDGLRDCGTTSMRGAAPHLMATFDLDERSARAVLTAWAETFDRRQTCDERAAVVVALGGVAA
jgi:hypothetical protein